MGDVPSTARLALLIFFAGVRDLIEGARRTVSGSAKEMCGDVRKKERAKRLRKRSEPGACAMGADLSKKACRRL